MRKAVTILIILMAVGSLPSLPLFAQDTNAKQQKQAQKVKTKLRALGTGERVKVKVKLYNGASHKGHLSQAGDDDFVVVDTAGVSHTVRYSDVRSIGGKNMSTGKKIAIGVGIGAGVTLLVLYLVFLEITENN